MARTLKSQAGLSLVEVTIMLLVLMLLTGVLAPSIQDFVIDAKHVKVKEDCEAIGVSIERFKRDNGSCFKEQGWLSAQCNRSNRIELLVSDGPETNGLPGGTVTGATQAAASGNDDNVDNWDDDDLQNTNQVDTLEDHLVINAQTYPTVPAGQPGHTSAGPFFNLGWRGAYLAPQIGPDPWNRRYMVNVVHLPVTVDGDGSGQEGDGPDIGWNRDVFCISAGQNQLYQTRFDGNGSGGVTRGGDDFIYVIGGSTR